MALRESVLRGNLKAEALALLDARLAARQALEARHLVTAMTAAEPGVRPAPAEVLLHPLFWDAKARAATGYSTRSILAEM